MIQKLRRAIDWFIRDKKGQIRVFQFPNLPLLGWFFCMVLNFATKGTAQSGLAQLSLIFLSIWAYLEITRGASYFRRTIGCIVAFFILIGLFS